MRDDCQDSGDRHEPKFSLNDFKKWMASQEDRRPEVKSGPVGRYAESRISVKRLVNHMTAQEGDLEELAREFRRNGGTVKGVDREGGLLIEVQSGLFHLPRFFARVDQD